MKMESRYEEEKMACVYNIMEKNKLRKETGYFSSLPSFSKAPPFEKPDERNP